MKMLLHNPITHLFLKRVGEWTLDPDVAMHFPDISSAQRYCSEHHLSGIQLFLKLEGVNSAADLETAHAAVGRFHD